MTPEHAQQLARYLRRAADRSGDSDDRKLLREGADIIAAAAAPPQPAAVKRRCGQCAWWSEIEDLRPRGIGRCLRHPPVIGRDGMSAQWPKTVASEWCGEFKSQEVEA